MRASCLRKMVSSKMASGIDFIPEQENTPCDACELDTKRRATFKMAPRADLNGCNNVVHSDIAGPVEFPSIKLERYVLLFVDDYSRYCTVRLLRKRSEMFQCFLEFKAAVKTKHNRSLRHLISDNGGEYLDGALVKYCRDHGIQRDTTIAYTPEQHGMAKFLFRILFNKVRTILISSGSPKQLWGEAAHAMIYTYSLPVSALLRLSDGMVMLPTSATSGLSDRLRTSSWRLRQIRVDEQAPRGEKVLMLKLFGASSSATPQTKIVGRYSTATKALLYPQFTSPLTKWLSCSS
ncbi:Integrase core domain [Phytophthora infestans]|uniref:Integrase core domain n=1 Tax=Phytophthora infestans TaxID=4787 RepID=A0A8S9U9D7_PHYIN|nr:Integrase core domain [Phytophthora infestans]